MRAEDKERAKAALAVIEYQSSKLTPLFDAFGVKPAVFNRVAANAIAANPRIAQCTDESLMKAAIDCVELALLPDGREAAIVPFKNQATLVPMINGRLKLAQQATPGLVVRPVVVYRGDDEWPGDEWEYREGLDFVLRHVPARGAKRDAAHLDVVYAIARAPGWAEPDYEVMYREQIDRIMARSPAFKNKNTPWHSHYEEMAKKTVMGRILKRLPRRAGARVFDPGADEFAADDLAEQGFEAVDFGAVDRETVQQPPAAEPDGIIDAEIVDDGPPHDGPPHDEPPIEAYDDLPFG